MILRILFEKLKIEYYNLFLKKIFDTEKKYKIYNKLFFAIIKDLYC